MPCTTILVGKNASWNGTNMIARNDDSGSGYYTAKKFVVVSPKGQPNPYTSKISHVTIDLPDNPVRYTSCPNIDLTKGLWGECGVNEYGVGMTATETITTNARVLGADPMVVYDPETGKPGGIGEEDMVTIVLPYVKTAREAVKRLGMLLEEYGTYESNGIGFSDDDEIWWLETIGGHHWMARRVPDDAYVVVANQLGIDFFDFDDAYGEQKDYMCSADLKAFTENNHLDLTMDGKFNPRDAYGSHSDADHVYNTPRTWYMERYFNPNTVKWQGPKADFTPTSDDIPWSMIPESKITPEDIKYILSSHYQGTPYDPYETHGDTSQAGIYRPIGINRNTFLGLIENRPNGETLEWLAFASNPFNAMVPYYADITSTPEYLANTTLNVNTDNCYWTSRLIAAMASAAYGQTRAIIERYENNVGAKSRALINKYDALLEAEKDEDKKMALRLQANEELAAMAQAQAQDTLNQVLFVLTNQMKNAYSRDDA